MYSFDDYYYFYLVVKYGGFSQASAQSNITKSKLSRRIVELEKRFQIKLIQRSTRHFKVTSLGEAFYQECEEIVLQAENADNILFQQKSEPQGLVRISCPEVMMRFQIRKLLNDFLKKHPKVELELELTSRRVDIIHDNIDIAIRTTFDDNENSSLIVRDLVKTTHCLVASSLFLENNQLDQLQQLEHLPSIVLGTKKSQYRWQLKNIKSFESTQLTLHPRIRSNDLAGIYYAVCDDLGVANLPYLTVEADLKSGRLIHLFPDWQSNIGTVQLVYADRKGQRLVVEKLIQVLVEGIRDFAKHSSGYIPMNTE